MNLSHRTSESIMLQQYSTPAPIGYLVGLYARVYPKADNGIYFEPSAGNGLLTIAAEPKYFIVNEIDKIRNRNLKSQGYREVWQKDASEPFVGYKKYFDAVITNPPFGSIDVAVDYATFPIKSLEQLMALRALDTMKDDGRAAIIIGGHTKYDAAGRIQKGKNRIFFNYLFHYYHVEDVININGNKLYSRMGTSFNVRLILIDGRKTEPVGYAPLKPEKHTMTTPYSPIPVDDFSVLFDRVKQNL